MSKEILKNRLLKNYIKLSKTECDKELFSSLLKDYIQAKTKSSIVHGDYYIDDQKVFLIKCAKKEKECKFKKIKKLLSLNTDNVVYDVPNAEEIENELTSVINYLNLENKMDIDIVYNEKMYYSLQIIVVFLNEELSEVLSD